MESNTTDIAATRAPVHRAAGAGGADGGRGGRRSAPDRRAVGRSSGGKDGGSSGAGGGSALSASVEVVPVVAHIAHVAVHSGAAHDAEHCLVCAELMAVRCLLPCGHDAVCATCCSRMRLLAKDRRCLLCKAEVEYIVATRDAPLGASYHDFGIYGNIGGPSLTLDVPTGIFFHSSADDARRALIELRQFRCGVGDGNGTLPHACTVTEPFSGLNELATHLAQAHGVGVCTLCAANRAVFVMELPRMGGARLAAHCAGGDPVAGFAGHPLCRFCDRRFYGEGELFSHLEQEHFGCHVCARNTPPGQRSYWVDYAALARHYTVRHFACDDAECLARKFVVFASELELRAHAAAEHGVGTSADLTAHMPFRYRSAGAEGGNARGRRGAESGGDAGGGSASGAAGLDDEDFDSHGRPLRIILTPDAFPSLRQASANAASAQHPGSAAGSSRAGESGGTPDDVNGAASLSSSSVTDAALYPALAGTSTASGVPSRGVGFARAVAAVAAGGRPTSLGDFPALGGGPPTPPPPQSLPAQMKPSTPRHKSPVRNDNVGSKPSHCHGATASASAEGGAATSDARRRGDSAGRRSRGTAG